MITAPIKKLTVNFKVLFVLCNTLSFLPYTTYSNVLIYSPSICLTCHWHETLVIHCCNWVELWHCLHIAVNNILKWMTMWHITTYYCKVIYTAVKCHIWTFEWGQQNVMLWHCSSNLATVLHLTVTLCLQKKVWVWIHLHILCSDKRAHIYCSTERENKSTV